MNNIFKKNVNSVSVFSSSSDIWNVNGKKCIYTSLFFPFLNIFLNSINLRLCSKIRTQCTGYRAVQFTVSKKSSRGHGIYCKSIWALCLRLEHLNILPEIRAVKEALSQVFCQDFFLYIELIWAPERLKKILQINSYMHSSSSFKFEQFDSTLCFTAWSRIFVKAILIKCGLDL